jgi:HEAT repeat protein
VVPTLLEVFQTRDLRRMDEWLKWKAEVADWNRHVLGDDTRHEPRKALRNVEWYFRHALEEHARVESIHEAALKVFGRIGPAASAAMPVLVEALEDPSRRVRLAAVQALGRLGPAAGTALPSLVQHLTDGSEPMRKVAAEALGRIDPAWASRPECQGAIASLAAKLQETGEPGRVAVEAFVLMGSAAVPVLVEALSADDRVVREAAATTLGRIGAEARGAIPALLQVKEDSHGWVREAALQALQKIDAERSCS